MILLLYIQLNMFRSKIRDFIACIVWYNGNDQKVCVKCIYELVMENTYIQEYKLHHRDSVYCKRLFPLRHYSIYSQLGPPSVSHPASCKTLFAEVVILICDAYAWSLNRNFEDSPPTRLVPSFHLYIYYLQLDLSCLQDLGVVSNVEHSPLCFEEVHI